MSDQLTFIEDLTPEDGPPKYSSKELKALGWSMELEYPCGGEGYCRGEPYEVGLTHPDLPGYDAFSDENGNPLSAASDMQEAQDAMRERVRLEEREAFLSAIEDFSESSFPEVRGVGKLLTLHVRSRKS